MGLQWRLSCSLKLSPISILRPSSQSTKIPLRRPLLLVRALSASAANGLTTIPPATTADDYKVAKAPQWKAAIDFIRENKEAVAANVKNRNFNANIDLVVELYDKLMNVQKEVEGLRAERNAVANQMKGKLEPSERQKLVEEGKSLKERLVTLEEDLFKLTDELQQEAQCVPNMTHPDVPVGGEDCSIIRKMAGKPREFNFSVKDHVQLGKDLNIFDFDAAAEVYSIEGSDHCLIGTAEIPVGGIHMDSIIPESSLPLKYVAFSHCFRTEAGAAGAATRGLFRVHQFSKVEMFIFCRPEESNSFHEELIEIEEYLFSSLGLHFKGLYRVHQFSKVEMFIFCRPEEKLWQQRIWVHHAYCKFDVEAWMPGLGRYGEISSASNCTDYQSRRLGIRYRPESSVTPKKGKGSSVPTQFVHTPNATACAVPRMIVCLLENYQQQHGSVVIPEPLRPFMGGLEIITPKSK
ncbi:Seryl-tRNA synthetase [Forsythia ovata]|uniref:serine--tRNA ligase n=1 Tax=Forsythia ovata TaxID=205694 RepID=A0ABD1R3R5_9LAMI